MILPHFPANTDADTRLDDVLDPLARVLDLPFWLEEATGRMPSDAVVAAFETVGDLERWVESVGERVG